MFWNVRFVLPDPEVLTVTVEHDQTCHHQGGVPVELLVRSIPCKSTSPLGDPIADAGEAGHAQTQQKQIEHVEAHVGPHPGPIYRLKPETTTCSTIIPDKKQKGPEPQQYLIILGL